MTKKILMILFDLDGTLLNSQYYILDKTKDEIRQLREMGIGIVLCSGRYPGMMKLYMNQTKADWMISMNGALIQSSDGHILKESLIECETADFIINKCNQYQLPYIIQNNHDIYLSENNPRNFMIQIYNELVRQEDMCEIVIKPLSIIPKRIHKIMILTKNEEKVSLLNEFMQLPITVTASASNLIEITATSVSKGSAAQYLASVCGIESNCMCAYGDSDNDISLFKTVGSKFAMSNAVLELKMLADAVIGSNNEKCIAEILARIREDCL